ncbi:hypothetical protein BDY24DRAFT_280806 [Mrakia frigida]|uniref:uncharacterized protein n=1 Tax=Mrakia frigida TaxID=29902 RepID=UPI003FCC0D2A
MQSFCFSLLFVRGKLQDSTRKLRAEAGRREAEEGNLQPGPPAYLPTTINWDQLCLRRSLSLPPRLQPRSLLPPPCHPPPRRCRGIESSVRSTPVHTNAIRHRIESTRTVSSPPSLQVRGEAASPSSSKNPYPSPRPLPPPPRPPSSLVSFSNLSFTLILILNPNLSLSSIYLHFLPLKSSLSLLSPLNGRTPLIPLRTLDS